MVLDRLKATIKVNINHQFHLDKSKNCKMSDKEVYAFLLCNIDKTRSVFFFENLKFRA